MLSWQLHEHEQWSKSSSLFNAIVNEPLSALLRTHTLDIHVAWADEPEAKIEKIWKFPYFCREVLNFGGYVVFLVDCFIIDVWLSIFNKTSFNVMPQMYT